MASVALAACLDAVFGWPEAAMRRVGHPVVWMGHLVSLCTRLLNRGSPADRRRRGALTVALVLAAVLLPSLVVQWLLPGGALGVLALALLAWPFVAIRSLHDHVAAVARPLAAGDMAGARRAVARIVGRDPARLDAPGIARAAIESLAENASDAVVAPVFWGALLGLPGIAGYKAINTMDSMIGHLTPDLADFGRAAARLDDIANLVPARLTGALIALVAPAPGAAFRTMRRDAPGHRSPNAGWPEAAMAAALGIRLSGPRHYSEGPAAEPWLNPGCPDPGAAEIGRALLLARRALVVLLGSLAAGALW